MKLKVNKYKEPKLATHCTFLRFTNKTNITLKYGRITANVPENVTRASRRSPENGSDEHSKSDIAPSVNERLLSSAKSKTLRRI